MQLRNFGVKATVMLLSAFAESESLSNFKSILPIDTGLYSKADVIAEIAKIMTNSTTLDIDKINWYDKMFDASGAVTMLEAFDQSESFKNYEKIPDFNERLYASESLVEKVASLIRGSSTLKELDLSSKALDASGAASIISAFADSPSLENFDYLPLIDAHLYESEEVQEEIKKVIRCSKRFIKVDLA